MQYIVNVLAAILSINIWIVLYGYWRLQEPLPPDLEGVELILSGYIHDLPESFPNGGMRLILDVTAAQQGTVKTNFTGHVLLTWYKNHKPLKAGEQWQLQVKLKAPHGNANPGSFDYEQWLFRNNIKAIGTISNTANNRRLNAAPLSIVSLRQQLRDLLLAGLTPDPGAGIIIASILGDSSGIGREQWEILNRAGISHLVAISGANLSLIGGWAFLLINWLWRRSPYLCLRVAAQQAAAVGGLILVWAYAMLAGSPIPTLRALVMFALVQGALLIRRTPRITYSFPLVLLLVLLADPLATLSPGFWLSFGAVAIFIYGLSNRLAIGGWLRLLIRTQWLMTLGLIPLLTLWFGHISLLAPVVNLVAIPMFALLLPLALIATILALATAWFVPLQIIANVLNYSLNGLENWVQQPWVIQGFADSPLWVWLAACLGTLLLLAPRGLPGRWAGVLLILPLWLWRPPPLAIGTFKATVLDVGQGLAVLIQTRSNTLVYDTGPAFPANMILVPVLHAYGINHIDRVIISHADTDHGGGLPRLLSQIPVVEILSGEPKEITTQNSTHLAKQCTAGQTWNWDGVQFTILYPQLPWSSKSNDRSCVLQVRSAGGTLLLTGDLGESAEVDLARRIGSELHSQVLVAGHHGSNSSTSRLFLSQVHPQWVLISAGYRNRFDFPKAKMLERVTQAGAKFANTATSGALEILFDNKEVFYSTSPVKGRGQGVGLFPLAYRQLHVRPWTHLPNPDAALDTISPLRLKSAE